MMVLVVWWWWWWYCCDVVIVEVREVTVMIEMGVVVRVVDGDVVVWWACDEWWRWPR